MKKTIGWTLGGLVLLAGGVGASVAFAQGPHYSQGQNENRPMHMGMHGMGQPGAFIQGNGQPIVGGSVTAVNGSAITITNKSNVSYAVDAASAVVFKEGATSSVRAIATGDNLMIQGAVQGTAVTAATIVDSGTRGFHGPFGFF